MGCYTSVIDNLWGNGSRASVERYADERGVAVASLAPSIEPTIELWRAIISADAVTCPQPVAAAPVRAKTTTTTKSSSTPRTVTKKAAPKPVVKAPAKKAAPAKPKITNKSFGVGKF